MVSEKRTIQPFTQIILNDNIDLELHDKTDTFAVVTAGEHLIDHIKIEQTGEKLTISNTNSCNWARTYDKKITVSIGINQNLLSLEHHGYGQISGITPLPINYLLVGSFEAGGDIDLMVTNNTLVSIYSNSMADLRFSGQSKGLNVKMDGIGRIYTENLKADTCKIEHNGSNTIRVFPIYKLEATINKNGNIIYFNEPVQIIKNIKGSGQLIKE